MKTIKLAEALLRRKELQEKVDRLKRLKDSTFVEPILRRVKVSDGFDDIVGTVPKFTVKELDAEYNIAAKNLRLVDAVIQQANWTTEVQLDPSVLVDD